MTWNFLFDTYDQALWFLHGIEAVKDLETAQILQDPEGHWHLTVQDEFYAGDSTTDYRSL